MQTWAPRRGLARNDGEVVHDDTDWAGYYVWSSGREPRLLLLAACEELGDGAGRMAVDLGCGEGTDTLELLARGWTVTAVDAEPSGLASLRARIPTPATRRIQIVCASFTQVDLPRAHLIHAGFSLPFCPPPEFPALWTRIRRALVPGGIFAGQLFGTRDSWAGDPDMTFHTRQDVQAVLTDLQILRLSETERDGQAFSGPKHWHTFDVLARNPVSIRYRNRPATGHGHHDQFSAR
jgi:SAM-dependent methyltransferase